MKNYYLALMILFSVSAKAQGVLDHPGFRVDVQPAQGQPHNSVTEAGKRWIKEYIGSLKSSQREKVFTLLNLNLAAIQKEDVKSAFAKLNDFCGRDDSIVEVRICIWGDNDRDISYNIRIFATSQKPDSLCPLTYDMEDDVSDGKYDYIPMGTGVYNDEFTTRWFFNTIELITNRVGEQQLVTQKLDQILRHAE